MHRYNCFRVCVCVIAGFGIVMLDWSETGWNQMLWMCLRFNWCELGWRQDEALPFSTAQLIGDMMESFVTVGSDRMEVSTFVTVRSNQIEASPFVIVRSNRIEASAFLKTGSTIPLKLVWTFVMINTRWRWDEIDQSLHICNCYIDQRRAGIELLVFATDRLGGAAEGWNGRKHSILVMLHRFKMGCEAIDMCNVCRLIEVPNHR
jgi:hypothetical protein